MDRRSAGLKALSEMLSPELAEQMDDLTRDTFAGHIMEMTVGHVYGELWSRPGLDRKSRSLITLGMLIAQGAEEELRAHIAIARNNGCTQTEIEEILYHATAYVGFPAANAAKRAAAHVFATASGGTAAIQSAIGAKAE